jgi:hypothetical protein
MIQVLFDDTVIEIENKLLILSMVALKFSAVKTRSIVAGCRRIECRISRLAKEK